MRVGIVGAGPAGSLAAYRLACHGADVTIFDPSHPREKPCGGGLTAKCLPLLPTPPKEDPLPRYRAYTARFESAAEGFDVALDEPVTLVSRRELDEWLLRRATEAGARLVRERVVSAGTDGQVRTEVGTEASFEVLVGADGAGSVVRRAAIGPPAPERILMAVGWFARGRPRLTMRLVPEVSGYLWLFPRPHDVSVGLCAPLGAAHGRDLLRRLEVEVAATHPELLAGPRWAHTIPHPSARPESILEIAGERWALLGDAAALAHPITGEGMYSALLSAHMLAQTLAEGGSPHSYAERVLEELGRPLLRAALLRPLFLSRTAGAVVAAARHRLVRRWIGDALFAGARGARESAWSVE